MIQSRSSETRISESEMSGDMTTSAPGERFSRESEQVRQKAKDTVREAGEKVRETGDKLRQAGERTKEELMRSTRRARSEVQQRADAMIAERKARAADEVSVFGQALHQAASTLDEKGEGNIGTYVHQAADLVDSCADWLRNQEPGEMLRGCGNFTRRHPEVVLGGLFVAGIAVARFLKASDRKREDEEWDIDLRDRPFEADFDDESYYTSGLYEPASNLAAGGMSEDFGSGMGMSQAEDRPSLPGSPTSSSSTPALNQPFDTPKHDAASSNQAFCNTPSSTSATGAKEIGSPNPVRDDDLNTIGRNEPGMKTPSSPK